MDRKTFNRKLGNVVKSTKSLRDNVQELIVAALVHYESEGGDGLPTGDTGYMTDLVRACQGVRALPTTTISEYIKIHANVGWGKLKDGKPGFKKVGKEVEVTMPEVTWYDWEGGKHNEVKSDYQFLSSIKSAITKAVTAHEQGKISAENWEAAKKAAETFGIEITVE